MKTKIALLLATSFYLAGTAYADRDLSYSDLVKLETNTVKTYEGFRFNISWAGGKPTISIEQEQTNINTKQVNTKSIAIIKSDVAKSFQDQTNAELLTLESFTPAKVVPVFHRDSDDNRGDLAQFNMFDGNGKIRSSEWRNTHNGFSVESILYSADGKAIAMTFYYHLKVNKSFRPIFSGTATFSTLDNAIKVIGPFDTNDANSTLGFCKKLLNHILAKSHFDTDDEE